MAKVVITGGRRLHGRVRVGGRKNSVVAVIPATLLAEGASHIENLPAIGDVSVYADILKSMGLSVRQDRDSMSIDPTGLVAGITPPRELAQRLRASYYLLGVLLARFGEAEVALPGGCDIGLRPIDQHIKGFRALGAEATIEHGVVRVSAPHGLTGAQVYLDVVSVGATINIMLAATLADGTTTIENAAKEPHIVDLADYLNSCGAKIQGAGTDVIRIRGVKSLSGCVHAVIPDEIEAATFMIAAAATRGDVLIDNVIPKHLDPITAKLVEAGAEVTQNGDSIRVTMSRPRPRAVNVKTLPYPGFPTDAQQPMSVLLSVAEGTSFVTESIWEGRFKHVDELKRMGTNIRVEGRMAIIEGVPKLMGAPVRATDLRAGAALIIAGLMAEGQTEISGIEHVDRGYERLSDKFRALGAKIARMQG
ncbi:MAG TPA: UDP-N-acetylglucosamine 1-carboxyvinyltransferase [Bacillota bacterium]